MLVDGLDGGQPPTKGRHTAFTFASEMLNLSNKELTGPIPPELGNVRLTCQGRNS